MTARQFMRFTAIPPAMPCTLTVSEYLKETGDHDRFCRIFKAENWRLVQWGRCGKPGQILYMNKRKMKLREEDLWVKGYEKILEIQASAPEAFPRSGSEASQLFEGIMKTGILLRKAKDLVPVMLLGVENWARNQARYPWLNTFENSGYTHSGLDRRVMHMSGTEEDLMYFMMQETGCQSAYGADPGCPPPSMQECLDMLALWDPQGEGPLYYLDNALTAARKLQQA